MSTEYIDLHRRFRDLERTEIEDPESLLSVLDHDLSAYGDALNLIGWPELLEHDRVVLLAESGAGKTTEMEEQAKRLAGDGKPAFFLTLNALAGGEGPINVLLSREQGRRLETWMADGAAAAWFFLDAADKMKLAGGELDPVLRRLSRDIDIRRARIVISCRPGDWQPDTDPATVLKWLPVEKPEAETSAQPSEEAFLAPLHHDDTGTARQQGDANLQNAVRTVTLLPMNREQIERLSKLCGIDDTERFLEEIDRQDAWHLGRTPLGLYHLSATWKRTERLGTRAEQYEASVEDRLREQHPGRPDGGVLDAERARRGAEKLALALALTRKSAVRSPEPRTDGDESVLDPAQILTCWTEKEWQALLRRPLFDPAGYGRVRFHHLSVQDYLAARCLRRLREKGMSANELFRHLFGQGAVFPAMREIAAWIALWDAPTCNELVRREPEILLSHGDPGSLNSVVRAAIVRSFVDKYGRGGRRGLKIHQVHRLAHPDLAPAIRECWGNGPANEEVRDLLIALIEAGPVEACADLANAAARNKDWDPYHRAAGIRALIACDRINLVQELADEILRSPGDWPDEVVTDIAPDLFPNFIATDGLISLAKRIGNLTQAADDFAWPLRKIARDIQPWSKAAVALRDGMADLVWRGRAARQKDWNLRSRFDRLAPPLATLCGRQLEKSPGARGIGLIRACVIASRFGRSEGSVRKSVAMLRDKIAAAMRPDVFWAELELMDEIVPADDGWRRFFRVAQYGLVFPAASDAASDRRWLLDALGDESRPERRAVALHALIRIRQPGGQVALDDLRRNIRGDAALGRILEESTVPPTPEQIEKDNKHKREIERHQQDREREEERQLKERTAWRTRLLADPDDAFSPEKRDRTLNDIFLWLRQSSGNNGSYNFWNEDALKQAFGTKIVDRTVEALREYWRGIRPTLWSERPVESKGQTPCSSWVIGLAGVSAEIAKDGAAFLTPEEACTAATYATVVNGFAPFVADLVAFHPAEVEKVIGGEASAQLRMGDEHLPILQYLAHAEAPLKRLLTPRLLAEISDWPHAVAAAEAPRQLHRLGYLLRILIDGGEKRADVARECAGRYEADPEGGFAIMWLRGLFQVDAARGARLLTESLSEVGSPAVRKRGVETFAGVFCPSDAVDFGIEDRAQRADALERLVRCAYACVRPEDDNVREGSFTPTMRDDAQWARNSLLSTLLDCPGAEARRGVEKLANEEDFADIRDSMLYRLRLALDAEFVPIAPRDVVDLMTRFESPPRDINRLMEILLGRLEDIDHDLAHGPFSNRRTLQSIEMESEMQRTLAGLLEAKANGIYNVVREPELADRKRSDFLLLAGDLKIAVEVKITDGHALNQLERALREQLVGRYMRHSSCAAGCLLLTYHGRQKFWKHPDTGERLEFRKVIEFLQDGARAIEREDPRDIRLEVFGIDLTDPPVA